MLKKNTYFIRVYVFKEPLFYKDPLKKEIFLKKFLGSKNKDNRFVMNICQRYSKNKQKNYFKI